MLGWTISKALAYLKVCLLEAQGAVSLAHGTEEFNEDIQFVDGLDDVLQRPHECHGVGFHPCRLDGFFEREIFQFGELELVRWVGFEYPRKNRSNLNSSPSSPLCLYRCGVVI